MLDANDIKIPLAISEFVKEDGTTKEKISGYVLYKGSPIASCNGWRIKDDTMYGYQQYTLNFSGTEDWKNNIDNNVLFLKAKETSTGSLRFSVKCHMIGEGDNKVFLPGFNPNLTSLVVPLSGFMSDAKVTRKFGEKGSSEVYIVELTFNEATYTMSKKKDQFKLLDMKTEFTDEELKEMKEKQFPYFSSFYKLFEENN